ncbi:uncharacterized protein LOC110455798 [Mizuhopecten yessoensis]|uniref:uncharacterized protein LOC110455798 n=1 Tax=Mizuhopecten yessoensis TaxID=6573 RepID=UPI000B45F364|nr:uncharacterized protein LOC110455798 [Mizuhopecten yessoensis]
MLHNRSCYYFSGNSLDDLNQHVTWMQAEEKCNKQALVQQVAGDKYLAMIEDEKTEQAIMEHLLKHPNFNGNYWLGASLNGTQWVWPSGFQLAQQENISIKHTNDECGISNLASIASEKCVEHHPFICEYVSNTKQTRPARTPMWTTKSGNVTSSPTGPTSTKSTVLRGGDKKKSTQIDTEVLMYTGVAVACVMILLVVMVCFIRKRMKQSESVPSPENCDGEELPVTSDWIVETQRQFKNGVDQPYYSPGTPQQRSPYDDCDMSGIHGSTTKFNPMYDCDVEPAEYDHQSCEYYPVNNPFPDYDEVSIEMVKFHQKPFNKRAMLYSTDAWSDRTPSVDYS